MRGGGVLAIAALVLGAGAAQAQGIDCTKARSPTEKAICAAPALLALDRQIAGAYADAAASHPDQVPAMRQEALRWLRARDAACMVPAAQLPRCLAGQMTTRLASLAPSTPAQTAQAAPPPAIPPSQPAAPLPGIPSAANPPAPAATIEPATVQAAERSDATLHVTSPGRFALAAHSKSGAAIQLVDMLTGPSDPVGEPGARDGRMDVLLDVGTYRLRAFAAKGADEPVTLTAEPFQDAAPPRATPAPGETFGAELRDKEQRAFWLLVPPSGLVQIEAAGRALADLRLWRDGRDLVALDPAVTTIEPAPGHTMLDIRLTGKVQPGPYLVVAYGGLPLPWADGDPAMAFNLRAGLSDALAEGWAGGRIGPFGSERYAAPAFAGVFRLDLPQPVAASLKLDGSGATLSRTSREPHVLLTGQAGKVGMVEVTGAAGQAFTLRASQPVTGTGIARPGTYWVSAVANGAGGDEAPPTVLLQRFDSAMGSRILAGNVPVLAPGAPWHGLFNLRGPTSLLFQNSTGGAVSLSTRGVPLRGDVTANAQFDLPADYYVLRLAPAPGALGVADVTVGAPGPAVPAVAPLPPDPVIPLGVQAIGPGQRLQLLTQSGPGLSTGLSARPVPVALAEGPLSITQAPNAGPVVVPVALLPGGTLAATELGGGPVAVQDEADGSARRITVPATDRPRTVVVAWRRTVPPRPDIPAPQPAAAAASLQPGTPAFFDLQDGQSRSFALDVLQGGLYRVETTGRLHTSGSLGTAFIPQLDQQEANGIGENMLLQAFLRAGRYRVQVAASASSGHLGLLASPAPLVSGAALLPGGSVRTTMPAGSGAVFPIRIAQAGKYQLDIAHLGDPFTVRLDDGEGWPLTRPEPAAALEQSLQPGSYSLRISPGPVAHQVAVRLMETLPEQPVSGHGPHQLPLNGPQQSATWHEPAGRSDPRTPDVWTFDLAGPAHLTLFVSDGMVADLRAADAERPVARITKRWAGLLGAGSYRMEMASLGRNDRLDYTVTAESKEMQPGMAEALKLPGTATFALAEPRVVSLTSWGNTPVKAVLRRTDGPGNEVVRAGARPEDWNLAISRLLPAGTYALGVAVANPPEGGAATPRDPGVTPATAPDDNTPTPQSDDNAATPPPDADDQAAQSAPATPRETQSAASDDSDAAAPSVEVLLQLPPALPPVDPPQAALEGEGVHVIQLAQPAPGTLLLAQGRSDGAAVLALERQAEDGWRVVALDTGTTPLVAVLADADPRPWRLQAWAVDGGPASIQLAVRTLDEPAQSPGTLALHPIEGTPLFAARVKLDGPGVLAVDGATWAAGWPGHAAQPIEDGQALAQTDQAWLIAPAAGPARLDTAPVVPGTSRTVTVPGNGAAVLAAGAAPAGHLLLWQAESGLGQPGFGMPSGIAPGSALALAGPGTTLRNAGGPETLRLRTTLLDLALLPEGAPGATVLPPRSALPVHLPGAGQVTVTLPPGTAALAGSSLAWTGAAALTRSFAADGVTTLVNTTAAPAPVALAWVTDAPPPLQPGTVFKRFFGAAGSFDRAVVAGGRLGLAGEGTLLWQGDDGQVRRGRSLDAAGPGHVVVTHGPGAVVLSLAAPDASPWPDAAPQPATMPQSLPLSGPAMALSLAPETPVLLHATTTAPVLLGLNNAPPELFAAGAEFHRAIPAGPALLRLYSAHDGPLSGTLALAAEPIRPVREGLGEAVAIAPGDSAAFGFTLSRPATVGLGVRAEPDRVQVRLLDAKGAVVGQGVAQLRPLPAGRYVLEARVPPDAPPSLVRPAVLGITPRGNGPPDDVAQHYLELVGLKPAEAAR